MKIIKYLLFFYILNCCSANSFGQYIQVNDTYTAQQLIENILINSPCANVSNFTVNGDPFSPGEQSFGYFNAGTSGFPFNDGIVLSTSRAKRTEGPNNNLIDEGLNSWTGDNDLEQALNITGTFNATILEFDFTPLTSAISFDYIFASEEYQGNAPCRYSDGFAFLLKVVGSTNTYQNLALIPNTTTPVLVTSVHPFIGGSNGCPAINENYFGNYNGNNAPINFNGQTVVLTAKATVIPGTLYHIKLVIADHENIRYDSAIFLGGGSFDVGTDLGPDQLIATNNPVCFNKKYLLDATESGINTYKWFRNNILIVGATNPTYLVDTDGVYRVEITLGTSTCVATGEVTIEYSPLPILSNTTIVQCDKERDGTTLFNLTTVDNIIKNNNLSLGNVTYYENLLAAQNQDLSQQITNPLNYQSVPKTIYASVSNEFGCANTASIVLQISNNLVANSVDLESCDLDGVIDGFYNFDLNAANAIVLNGLPIGLTVEYYETINDALLLVNKLNNNYRNTVQFQTIIYAKIVNGSDCYGIIALQLFVNSLQPSNFEDEIVNLCDGIPETIGVANTFITYQWSTGSIDSSINIENPGEYTVTVTDRNTCAATKKFIAIISGIPTITAVNVNDFSGNNNSILINYTGLGDYEFSLNGNFYQDSPLFQPVLSGEYTVWARDKNGCGVDFKNNIYVLNQPNFFTPNNDNYNDIWTIEFLNKRPNSTVRIFDRLGKFIYQFNGNEKGWDGKLNSIDLPSADYWFNITLENGKIIKGHFALKR